MSILDILKPAAERRQKKLDELLATRASYQADYEAAIEADDEAAADKARTKRDRADGEVRALREAIEATEAARRRQQLDAADARRLEAEALARTTFSDYAREAIAAEWAHERYLEQFRVAQAAFDVAHQAERAAIEHGSTLRIFAQRRVSPHNLFARMSARLLRALNKPGEQHLLFPSLPASKGLESCAVVLERELASIAKESP